MQRGELAKQADCNLETVRYYEKVGLMPDPPRSTGGHRVYDNDHLKRLTFIRRSRELGFTIDEVRGLLELVDGGNFTCAEIHDVTVDHVKSVQAKIADLKKLEKVLKGMAAQCTQGDIPECHVIDALFTANKAM